MCGRIIFGGTSIKVYISMLNERFSREFLEKHQAATVRYSHPVRFSAITDKYIDIELKERHKPAKKKPIDSL